MLNKIFDYCVAIAQSMATLLKIAVQSKRPSKKCHAQAEGIIIMGNGPSLRTMLDNNPEYLKQNTLMAVNFAANSNDIINLQPKYYIIADQHFFLGAEKDDNVRKLWENIQKIDWEMTLCIPVKYKKQLPPLPQNLKIYCYNLTPAEGLPGFRRLCYDRGLAMPRPRNVLIPAIMVAMRLGFKDITIIGADHSWSKTLWVDNQNRVISVQPHFYKDNSKELDRVAQEYAGYHLHDIYKSLYIAFNSYHQIEDYARQRGVDIFNATTDSFIDAFRRKTILPIVK